MVETEDKALRGHMPDGLRQSLEMVLHTIFPPRCICCGAAVSSDFGLCGPCWRETHFITGCQCEACGAPLPGAAEAKVLCDDCLASPRPWLRGRAAFTYEGTGRQLVLAFKYADRLDLVQPLGEMLARTAAPLISPGMVVAPVPLHRLRLVKRMYNQSALLAQSMARRVRLPCLPDLFERKRATRSQEGLNRAAREANLEGAIRLRPKYAERIRGRPLLIVDDVMTSGATLAACEEAARAAGSGPVSVVVLARVAKDG